MDFLKFLSRLQSTDQPGGMVPVHAEQTAVEGPSVSLRGHVACTLCLPPAAARSFEDVEESAASFDQACTTDLEAPLEKSSVGSTADRICRICLAPGSADLELIQPCACSGTMGCTHAACLTAWVQAKGSLTCEICQEHYKAPFVRLLAVSIQLPQQQQQQQSQQQRTAPAEEGHEERQTGRKSWCGWLTKAPIGQWIFIM